MIKYPPIKIKDYGLFHLLESGKCPIICDAGLQSAAKKLAPKAFVVICQFHSMGCLLKNTLKKNLKYYDPNAEDKTQVILF